MGLYLRRSVAVSYEVLGLLFVPAVALCLHRFFKTSRYSWLGLVAILLLVLPATHHFSTVIAGVTLVVLAGIWINRQPTLRIIATGVTITASFWAYLLLLFTVPSTIHWFNHNESNALYGLDHRDRRLSILVSDSET